MGRRPKPPTELQDDIYSVRLTAAASKRLQELATASGRRRSDVIRGLIAEGHVVQTKVPEANLQVLPDLRRVGGLLNQIARKLHTGEKVDVREVRQACHQLARTFAGLWRSEGRDLLGNIVRVRHVSNLVRYVLGKPRAQILEVDSLTQDPSQFSKEVLRLAEHPRYAASQVATSSRRLTRLACQVSRQRVCSTLPSLRTSSSVSLATRASRVHRPSQSKM